MAKVTGGDKWKGALNKIARGAESKTLRVGFLARSRYPSGTSIPMVAAVNEFGSAKSPPRPYFRNMIAKNKASWPGTATTYLRDNGHDIDKALQAMGHIISGQLMESIGTYNAGPPLKPATIKRKGFDKQLIDTGVMWNSVDYEVV